MEEQDVEKLYRVYRRKLKDTPLSFTRYLYEKIDWNDRLIGIENYGRAENPSIVREVSSKRVLSVL